MVEIEFEPAQTSIRDLPRRARIPSIVPSNFEPLLLKINQPLEIVQIFTALLSERMIWLSVL
jgi:hypothetical protein